jgi:hypothetical protein
MIPQAQSSLSVYFMKKAPEDASPFSFCEPSFTKFSKTAITATAG